MLAESSPPRLVSNPPNFTVSLRDASQASSATYTPTLGRIRAAALQYWSNTHAYYPLVASLDKQLLLLPSSTDVVTAH